jgi:type IV pilus assembly protein PilX
VDGANRMLTSRGTGRGGRAAPQAGVVLFFALVVLVLMTIAALALMRSTITGNLIAGNVAFQQAATGSADRGIEAAVNWLETNNAGTTLHTSKNTSGDAVRYSAVRQDPGANQSWDDFWNNVLVAGGLVNTTAADAAGNVVSYVIQRLCNHTGDPTSGVGCEVSPAQAIASNSSKTVGVMSLTSTGQIYYRITVRAAGPANTLSYVQAIVAM